MCEDNSIIWCRNNKCYHAIYQGNTFKKSKAKAIYSCSQNSIEIDEDGKCLDFELKEKE